MDQGSARHHRVTTGLQCHSRPFKLTHSVAHARHARHASAASKLTTFHIGDALLEEHEWWMPLQCIPDHTVPFHSKNGEASVPSGIEVEEEWEDACRIRAAGACTRQTPG